MAQLIKGQKVTVRDGEITVKLELDLNLNVNGVQVGTTKQPVVEEVAEEEEKAAWIIPTFSSGPKVNFGKRED